VLWERSSGKTGNLQTFIVLIYKHFLIFSFDHWSLRLQAAEIVALITNKYKDTYTTLLPRITKTLAKALSYDPAINEVKPFSTHFGAIVGLTLMGTNVVDSVLMPMLDEYIVFIKDADNLKALGSAQELEKVISALRNAVNQWKEHYESSKYDKLLKSL
jgi:transcription initiation factor TFIID subunit 6